MAGGEEEAQGNPLGVGLVIALILAGITGLYNPSIAVDGDAAGQSFHLVWEKRLSTQQAVIQYGHGRVEDGDVLSWTLPITLSDAATRAVIPAVRVAADGDLHVMWGAELSAATRRIYHRRWDADSASWGEVVSVVAAPIYVNILNPTVIEPAVALPGDVEPDSLCVAWHGCWQNPCVEEVWLSCSQDDGETWSAPLNLSRTPDSYSLFPRITFDRRRNLHLVWQESACGSTTAYAIYYARSLPLSVYLPLSFRGG
jgi:hypothetical protein